MNGKQVYVGVRVKITVREMLEKKRAKEARKKTLKMSQVSQACLDLQELCSTTFQTPSSVRVEPALVPQQRTPDCVTPALEPPQLPLNPSPDLLSTQPPAFSCTQPQFVAEMLPVFTYEGNNNNNNNNNPSRGYSYNPPLPPLTPSPQSWSQELSPQAYYSAVACYSSSDSLVPYSQWDGYLPQDFSSSPSSFSSSSTSSSSSSSPSCYSSPSRRDPAQYAFLSDQCQYACPDPQNLYSAPSYWPGQQESLPPTSSSSSSSSSDYPSFDFPDYQPSCVLSQLDQDNFRREFVAPSEMFYNLL